MEQHMEADFWRCIYNSHINVLNLHYKHQKSIFSSRSEWNALFLIFLCVEPFHPPPYQTVQTSTFIFQLLENSLILSITALEDEQILAEVTSTSSKAGMFLITGFYSSPVYREANTSRLRSPLKSHGWWLSTRTIWFCDLCLSKHLLIWFYSSFIRENTLDEWC